MQLEWGTVPAWISAGSIVFTAVTARLAYRKYVGDEEDRRDERQRQARLITVGATGSGGVMIVIKNNSTEPIFSTFVEDVRIESRPDLQWSVNQRVKGSNSLRWPIIPAGEEVELAVEFEDKAGNTIDFMQLWNDLESLRCSFQFTDRTGRLWRRKNHSAPTRVYH
jgi:hypothetical protein